MTGPPGSGAGESGAAGARRAGSGLARAVVAVPSRLPVLFFWATVVVSVALLLGEFRPAVVVPAVVVVWLLTWRLAPLPLPAGRQEVVGAAGALGLVAVWLAVNLPYASEVLLVQRDPGFLTLQAIWSSTSADPLIPLRTAADVAAAVPEASVVADAFWRAGPDMYAQGAKTLPGLLALGGWAAGVPGVLAANLVIGALALLAFYDVARRLLAPLWGLLPVLALALTTPMLYFTRTPFTEPATMVLTFGGLAMLWRARHGAAGRWQAGSAVRYGVAGAMVGAGSLTRIDGAAVVSGLVLALGMVVGAARGPRRALVLGWVAATVAGLLMVVLGYVDLRTHSAEYLADHGWLYRPLLALLAASVAAGALAIAVGPLLAGWLAGRGRRVVAGAAAAGVLVVAAVLASRPLWMQRRGVEPGSGQEQFVAAFQRAAGVAVDGTRSYDEMTVVWLSWYLGPVTVAVAAVAAALLLRDSVLRRAPDPFVMLLTLGVPAMLYLVRPSITPDQVWAMRRLLPAALPLVLLCATWLLARCASRAGERGGIVVGSVGAAALLVGPMLTWGAQLRSVEYDGRAGQVDALCEWVQGGRVVVVRGQDPPLLPTIRIMCDADVVEIPAPVDPRRLARIHEAWGGGEVHVVRYTSAPTPWPDAGPPTLTTRHSRWAHSLEPARAPVRFTGRLWLGTVDAEGTIEPVAPR